MFIIFMIALIVAAWLLLRSFVKQIAGIQGEEGGFFEEAVTPAHQKIRIVLSVCYLLLTAFFLYTLTNMALFSVVLTILAVLIFIDGVLRIYFELNHGTEPKQAALTAIDTAVIVGALIFGLTRLS
jgi:hypothetical protein